MPIYNVYFQFTAAYFQTNSSKDEMNKTDRLYPLQSQNGNLIVGYKGNYDHHHLGDQLCIAEGYVGLNNSSSSLLYVRRLNGRGEGIWKLS